MAEMEHYPNFQKDNYIHPKAAWDKLRQAGARRQNVYLYAATGLWQDGAAPPLSAAAQAYLAQRRGPDRGDSAGDRAAGRSHHGHRRPGPGAGPGRPAGDRVHAGSAGVVARSGGPLPAAQLADRALRQWPSQCHPGGRPEAFREGDCPAVPFMGRSAAPEPAGKADHPAGRGQPVGGPAAGCGDEPGLQLYGGAGE